MPTEDTEDTEKSFGFWDSTYSVLAVPNAWTEQPIHFIDFEGSVSSGIVEYGVATLPEGAVVTAQTRLCQPTGRMRREDIEIHGLDETALIGTTPIVDDFAAYSEWRKTGPLAAHILERKTLCCNRLSLTRDGAERNDSRNARGCYLLIRNWFLVG